MIEWNANPEIFNIGGFALRWYGLLFMMGFVLGYFIAQWMFKSENKPVALTDKLVVYMFFGTLIGARLGHCFFYEPSFYLSHPIEILKVWKGGLASHGGTIGIIVAIYIYSKNTPNQPFLWVLDRMAIVGALGAFFIRIGNFFNSEILGKPADVPWAVIFKKVDSVPRHPAMLYEALSYLIIFSVMIMVYRKNPKNMRPGWLVGVLLCGIFGARFMIEFFKENQAPFEAGMPLNMGQLLSLLFITPGLFLLAMNKFKPYTK